MSAECEKCGHDLPYEGDCAWCALVARAEQAEAERDKYRWQRNQAVADHCETGERPAAGVVDCDFCSAAVADLDRRWEEQS